MITLKLLAVFKRRSLKLQLHIQYKLKARMLKIFLFVSAVASVAKAGNSAVNAVVQNCIVPIGSKSNYLAQWPLIFNQNGKLYTTIQDEINQETKILIKGGEEVTLSCGPNYFKKHTPTEILKGRCNGETGNFIINGLEQKIEDLTCDLRVIEEVLDNVYGCVDNKWTATRFGYVDPITKETLLLGEACYDMTEGKTRFVHFKLGDQAFSHLEVLPKNYLTTHRHPDGRYKIEMFRGLQFDIIYERIHNTLHIRAPFLKMMHFIEEPLLPNIQFQQIKKLGWNYFVGYDENEILESLKSNIKRLSENLNLDIYTGSHGIKQLNGDKNEQHMEIYLHESTKKRFPMPNLIWFVIQHRDTINKGIAFAVANDDNDGNRVVDNIDNNPSGIKSICKESVCSKVTWLTTDLKQNNKLICCDINDLRQSIDEIPVLGDVKEMLF